MLAYADGDMEAFEALYRRHKKRIFGFLMTKLNNQTEAEEVFQAIFSKLHVARGKYREDIPFLPWIFTIARNALIDHIRKRDVYQKHVTTSELAVETYAEQATSDTRSRIDVEGLSSLTEAQRQALELRFNQGLTFAEIAEQLQTSADNSRQIISRAIRQLRKLMTGKEMDRETR
jgi:RNA polymerase sigma-70 factor (ECF subfamily)